MLSSYGAEVIAFFHEDHETVYHDHCAKEKFCSFAVELARVGREAGAELIPAIRYELQSEFDDGLTCDQCGEWIVEPRDYNHVPSGARAE